MKTLNFSKKSWHYWLANNTSSFGPPNNICGYLRAVIIGAIIALIVVGIVSGVVISMTYIHMHIIMGLIFSIFYGFNIIYIVDLSILILEGIIVVSGLLCYGGLRFNSWLKNKSSEETNTGFVVSAYRSWKDKYCARINFT